MTVSFLSVKSPPDYKPVIPTTVESAFYTKNFHRSPQIQAARTVSSAGTAAAAAAGASSSSSQNEVFLPVLETVCRTASGCTLPITVTFCSFMSMSYDSTPEICYNKIIIIIQEKVGKGNCQQNIIIIIILMTKNTKSH
ncbi:hypothetical protein Dimus_021328 [Dionaea muscipula]